MSASQAVLQLIDGLPVTGEEPCPYLPGRLARYRAFTAGQVPPLLYHQLMNHRFRRSGSYFYQPACRDCQACVPIRVPVDTFTPSRSQERVLRRNHDLAVEVRPPAFTPETFALYRRYSELWHGKADADPASFQSFLLDSPVETMEFLYRDAQGTLLAAGICDVSPASLSSVYFYFDPAHRGRSLGTYGALLEIEWARQHNIPHYYLGYWVRGSAKMDYKARFGPHELLDGERWQPAILIAQGDRHQS